MLRRYSSTMMGAIFGVVMAASAHAQSWSVLDISTLGGADSYAYSLTGINNAGQVTGHFSRLSSNEYHSFIADINTGSFREIDAVSGFNNTFATGINAHGQVIGYVASTLPVESSQAFITGPNGVGTTLFAQSGDSSSQALAINQAGEVVGARGNMATWEFQAFSTGANGTPVRELSSPSNFSVAGGINNSSQVVGFYTVADTGMDHAFIDLGGETGWRDLGTLVGDVSSEARAINDAGQVVGTSYSSSGFRAYITDAEGVGMRALDPFSGSSASLGLNSLGQVVGYSDFGGADSRAFITGPGGVGFIDVNSLVALPGDEYFKQADGVNDLGQIIASTGGRAYVLTPVPIPEPGTWALMALGMGCIAGTVLKRKKLTALQG